MRSTVVVVVARAKRDSRQQSQQRPTNESSTGGPGRAGPERAERKMRHCGYGFSALSWTGIYRDCARRQELSVRHEEDCLSSQ